MKIQLTPVNIYGSTQYVDRENRIVASKIGDKWYSTVDDKMFDAGFCNVQCMTDFIERLDEYEETLSMLGYERRGNTFISNVQEGYSSDIRVLDDGRFEFRASLSSGPKKDQWKPPFDNFKSTFGDFDKLVEYIINIQNMWGVNIFSSVIISSAENSDEAALYVIEAKMSTRDLTKNLVRVKSSNIWSYGIDIKNRKDKTGNVLVQFKDPKGGPGDLYLYYDVPVNLWRKWLSSNSKGHFLWRFIRNNFSYSKLTGDKKGKLPNAIN